ncbi:hypothetical protein ACFVGY_11555 [Streptomyces sp. NPDC127106]|uniref:hypothetical protein n=1 Tax=Streptomyces sp. NPDC127106 TaxID=3345360 RepID=UPI0036408968
MRPVVLACVVVPVTAVLYGVLGLLRRRQDRWHRVMVERAAGLLQDPYRAAAHRWWPGDDVQAAAAALLLDGLVTVNHRGNLSLTAAGSDPDRTAGHPLPDALLDALRRRTAPALLGNVSQRDAAFNAARAEFHAAGRTAAQHEIPVFRREPGAAGQIALLLVLAHMLVTVLALAGLAPRGPVESAAVAATAVGLVAQLVWFGVYGRLRTAHTQRDAWAEQVARAGLHPALAELARRDPEAVARLRTSRWRVRRGRNRGRPRRRSTPAGAPPA